MQLNDKVQHVYLVGAKSLGAYGGYETFVYKLTEYHQNKENIKYHVACKANGDGCMDESKFEGVTKINDHEFELHNAHCFKIDVPQIGPAQAIYYDVAALKTCCEHIKKNHIPHPIVYIMACRIGPFAAHFYKEIHKLGGTVFLNPDGHEWMRARWAAPIRKYWKISEQMMVKYCDLAICDSVNKPIIIYTLEAFQQHPSIDEIYVSCLEGWSAVLEAYAKQFNITKLKRIITGGATGQESIYNGLKAIKEDNEETKDIVVVIHDGNRPMLPQDVITDNLVKQKLFGSAVTVIPTTEVVFVSKDGVESNAALNREELWRTQTPHSYRFDELWTVHNQAIKDGVTNMAASCSLMQKYGYTTYFSKGSEKNIKITTVEDIEIFKALLSAKNDEWIKK